MDSLVSWMAVWVGTKDEKVCLEQKEADRVREGGWSLYDTGSQFLFLLSFTTELTSNSCCCTTSTLFSFSVLILHVIHVPKLQPTYQFPKAKALGLSHQICAARRCWFYSTLTLLMRTIFKTVWWESFHINIDQADYLWKKYCKSWLQVTATDYFSGNLRLLQSNINNRSNHYVECERDYLCSSPPTHTPPKTT